MKKFLVAALILAVGVFALPTTSFGYTYTGGGSTYDCGTPSGDFPMTFAGCRPGYYYEDWEDADDSLGPDEVGECLECPSGYTCAGGFAGPDNGGVGATCDEDEITVNGTCQTAKFTVTTTGSTQDFGFYLSAAGTFYIDWGDGTVETINRTNNTNYTKYEHHYSAGDEYTVRFGGAATGYNTDSDIPAITFNEVEACLGGCEDNWAPNIASIAGNLATLFPYIAGNAADGAQPRFNYTFNGAQLTTIPATLFSSYSTGAKSMFSNTFYGCTSLTTIPSNLFGGITTGADGMFASTFNGCTSLTTIPTGLFSGITTGAQYMFSNTFYGCTSLTTIPSNLFSGITTGASGMFAGTFQGCTSLTTIPTGLFSGITTGASYMFYQTFYGCTSLTTIPTGLFSGITTGASYMFYQTFYGCTNLSGYIPPTTFAGLIANGHPTATNMWQNAFAGTKLATSCPAHTTQYITGYEGSRATTWNGKVSCACAAGTYDDGALCTACANTKPANSSWLSGATTSTCPWACDAGYVTNGTSCDAATFSVTTTALSANDTFPFKLTAVGTFYVNWGDGTEQVITRTNTTETIYTHTYTSAGTYTIGFGGTATGYDTRTLVAAISFYNAGAPKIASINGNLSTIFPYKTSNAADGAQPRFSGTFRGATNLTQVPATLFSNYTIGANNMFSGTFIGCTSLTTIPSNLFSGITTGANSMFSSTFNGCTNLAGYIPPTTFAGLIANGHPTATNMWNNTFSNTQLVTSCPTGTTQYITGYEGSGSTTWNGKVSCTCANGYYDDGTSCTTCANTKPANSSWVGGATTSTCPWACDAGYISDGTSCIPAKFSVTTTNSTQDFGFYLSAKGTFYIDWGDGTTETIARANNTNYTKYEHHYSEGDEYTVRFGGAATGYNTDSYIPAITFNEEAACGDECEDNWAPNIASIAGNLATLFPYIAGNAADGAQPRFNNTFSDAQLTTIPATLFSGYTTGANYMFSGTFSGCTSLTTIPSNLFSGITTGANWMFQQTFYGCTALTTIPDGLFSGITTGASNMFHQTFYGCTSLTTIPSNLFGGITTGADYMFNSTFYGCTSLTTIPTGLFSGITTGASGMFSGTFSGCTSLTTIPTGLFSGITTGAESMFGGTFQGCSALTTIPTGLFSGITTGASGMFQHTFDSCSALTTIPTGLFSGITTGAESMFGGTFNGCTSLTTIPSGLFSGITTGASRMFDSTFRGCTNLSGYIPPTTFAGLIANNHPTATNMWQNAFAGTKLATSCPAHTTQYITGYEGSNSNTTWNGKVSCAENCPANNTTLRTSTGLIFPLYGEKLTTPALNIKFENDQICYAELRPGTASDTLNFSVPGGATYHAVPTTAN